MRRTITLLMALLLVTSLTNFVSADHVGDFCRNGEIGGNLQITDIDISTPEKYDEWTLFDEVRVEVEVENIGDNDIEEVIVEMGLFDFQGRNQADDLEFFNIGEEEIYLGDIDEGDDKIALFRFRVPAEFEIGLYELVFKAFPDGDEGLECTQEFFPDEIEIDVEQDEERVVVIDNHNIIVDPSNVTCGQFVQVDLTVYNIGEDEQIQVLVNMFDSELDLDEDFVIRQDMNTGDSEEVEFEFAVRDGLEDGPYFLKFKTYYDYDDDDDFYEEESEETWTARIEVSECGDSLEERVTELEKRVETLEKQTQATENLLGRFIKAVVIFIEGLPKGLRGHWDGF